MRPDWKECPRDNVMPQYAGIYVTMNPKGVIAMSEPTYKLMGSPEAFVLLFDTANRRIGLRPATSHTQNAYPVRVYSKQGGRKICAFRLMREFKISIPETVRFYDADTNDDGLLILDLTTARVSPRVLNHWSRKKRADEPQTVSSLTL